MHSFLKNVVKTLKDRRPIYFKKNFEGGKNRDVMTSCMADLICRCILSHDGYVKSEVEDSDINFEDQFKIFKEYDFNLGF